MEEVLIVILGWLNKSLMLIFYIRIANMNHLKTFFRVHHQPYLQQQQQQQQQLLANLQQKVNH